ncbi:MAG: L,D-transpeptidase [Thermoanaerobaculales bacterium]|nr:L,D-transpeptidase [Thermoanaerobaculales bacterium]
MGRPAERSSGRRPAAACLLAVIAALLGCGREPLPPPDAATWRPVLTRAITELRRGDPEPADRLAELVRVAEIAQAEAVAGGSTERATRAWGEAMKLAADEVERRRRADAELGAMARASIEAAAREVALADRKARAAGSSRQHARAAQAARLQLRLAESLIAADDPAGALVAAEDAIALADAAQDGWRRQQDRLADPELRSRWTRQVAETLEVSRRQGVAVVVVDKSARKVRVYRSGRQVVAFAAEIGTAGLAPKRHAGDRATPEGRYRVVTVKTRGATKYYKALLLDYPNADDRRRYEIERAAGTIPRGVGPGSLIEIHGHGGQGRDWTEGCVALRDEDMDRLLDLVKVGTHVTIVGRME